MIIGPIKRLKTAGTSLFFLEKAEHTYIDTEGGVTFLFDSIIESYKIKTIQICKYYN